MTELPAEPVTGRCGLRRCILFFLLSGLLTAAATAPPVQAQAAPPDRALAAHPHGAHIAAAARRFGIPAAWIVAVMRAESAGDMRAVSSAGALGLMQVMPHTWVDLRRRYALGPDPLEPRDNIFAGTAYLREPLPVSMWEEGCAWRGSAAAALERVGRDYRVAYMSAHAAGQRAAILADLAIAPLPKSFIGPGLQILCEDDGLPALDDYSMSMLIANDPAPPVCAVADHFRAAYDELEQAGRIAS